MGLLKAIRSCWPKSDTSKQYLYDDKGTADSKTSVQSPQSCFPHSEAKKGRSQEPNAPGYSRSSRHKRPDRNKGNTHRPACSTPVDRNKSLPPIPPSVIEQLATWFGKRVAKVFDKRPTRGAVQPSPPSPPSHQPTVNRSRSGTGTSATAVQSSPPSPSHQPTFNRSRSGARTFATTVQPSPPSSPSHQPTINRSRSGTRTSPTAVQPSPPSPPSHQPTANRSRSGTHSSARGAKVSPSPGGVVAKNVSVGLMAIASAGRDVIVNPPSPPNSDQRGWRKVVEHSAPSAIHTSAGLSGLGRCDAGTRVNVLRKIQEWARPRQPRVLCMTGAAGSGKSAIALTAAAHFVEKRILAATFFCSSSDNTRNNISRLVFTIAYQLGLLDDRLLDAIDEVVRHDPHIITASLATQACKLILEPFQNTGVPAAPIILIDGVDECNDEADQDNLISLITNPIWDTTPFRFFIIARPEVTIHDALKPGRCLHGSYCIRLSDDEEFDATEDIKQSLGNHLRQYAGDGAPDLKEAIDTIAAASSGQYVYSTAVIQYVEKGRRDCPLERLRGVVKWIRNSPSPNPKSRNPLHALDELYRKILSNAAKDTSNDDPSRPPNPGPLDKADEVDPIFLVLRAFASLQISTVPPGTSKPESIHDSLLGLRSGSFTSVVCDVRSLVRERERTEAGPILQFYHRTCLEFLQDERRAGKALYYPKSRIDSYLLKRLCGVFTSSADHAAATIAAKDGLFADDETTWVNCTSASLFGGILRLEQKPKEKERALKRFQTKDPGFEKLKTWALLASKYPQFAEDGLVRSAFVDWGSCLRALENSKDTELATAARAALGVMGAERE